MTLQRRAHRHFVPRYMLVFLLALCSACGADFADAERIEPSDLVVLPVPTDDVVLTVRGDVEPNVGNSTDSATDNPADNTVQLDLEGIEGLGTTTLTIHEPFINRDLVMTGVEIDRLLDAAGVAPEAELLWTALDDYTVDYSRAAAAAEQALLVTRVDGMPIAVEDGGPIRVVFPSDQGRLGGDTNQWIWSLRDIEVG